jgi:hypothetical protein
MGRFPTSRRRQCRRSPEKFTARPIVVVSTHDAHDGTNSVGLRFFVDALPVVDCAKCHRAIRAVEIDEIDAFAETAQTIGEGANERERFAVS